MRFDMAALGHFVRVHTHSPHPACDIYDDSEAIYCMA